MPWKTGGGGGGAQSHLPTRDHQNILNLILIWRFFVWVFKKIITHPTRSPHPHHYVRYGYVYIAKS